jgi:hypothetical protein
MKPSANHAAALVTTLIVAHLARTNGVIGPVDAAPQHTAPL